MPPTLDQQIAALDAARTSNRPIAPSAVPGFAAIFAGPSDKVLRWLKCRAYALPPGEVAKDTSTGWWVDAGCNFYSGKLTAQEAGRVSSSNKGCMFCIWCEDCTDCVSCDRCKKSVRLQSCKLCSRCVDSAHCIGCERCTDCVDCVDCVAVRHADKAIALAK